MCRDLENRVKVPSRSLKMSPFDRAHITSYWRYILNSSCLVSLQRYSMWKNIDLKSGSGSIKVIESGTIRYIGYGFLLAFCSNFVPKMFDFKCAVTLKTGLGFVQVIENVTIRYSAYDCLLTFHSNHVPISYRFRDRRQFLLKITNFSHRSPCILCLRWRGSPWNWVLVLGVRKLEWWAIGPRKKFDDIISRLDTMHQRHRRTDGHRATAKIALAHSVAR